MNPMTTLTTAYGLRVLAEAHADGAATPPPPLPGFASSGFNPLVAEVADRCLGAHHGAPPAPGRTALLLASTSGDRATGRAIDQAAEPGRRAAPLLFFQSNPNAVLGHIAARWGLTGPVVAIRPAETASGRIPADALDHAALLIADGDAECVLIIAAEETADGAHEAVAALLAP